MNNEETQNDFLDIRLKKDIVIVPQTKVAFIGYLLLIIVMITGITIEKRWNATSLIHVFVYVLICGIALYATNCTVVGKCNMYAWIISSAIAFIGLLGAIGSIMMIHKMR